MTDVVEQTHRAVAGRVLGLVTGFPDTGDAAHGVVAAGAYAAVRAVGAAAGDVAGTVAGEMVARQVPDPAPVATTRRGNRLQAVLNAAVGHQLDGPCAALSVTMAVRAGGADVPLTTESLATVFPAAAGRVVVFLHGLTHDEHAWSRTPEDPDSSYGSRLAEDTGITPVFLRYSSGLRIAENGLLLARLLDDLVAAWPVPVDELVLVGHSMGGLVVRSACHQGQETGLAWVPLVGLVVTLGSPHAGAPLERLAALARAGPCSSCRRPRGSPGSSMPAARASRTSGTATSAPTTVSAATRTTACATTAAMPLRSRPRTYLVVAATVTSDPWHPLGRLLGDLLVPPDSAHGRSSQSRPVGFDPDDAHLVGGAHHLDLLDDPAVYARLRDRLLR